MLPARVVSLLVMPLRVMLLLRLVFGHGVRLGIDWGIRSRFRLEVRTR